MSSTSSPAPWILQQQPTTSSRRVPATVEPLNLWPSPSSSAAWAINYNAAMASLAVGNEPAASKYPSRNSPLTPTSPTCSPPFSPSSITSFASHPYGTLQHPPDSPHSVIDGFLDFPPPMTDFCPSSTSVKRHQQPDPHHTLHSNGNKRCKSFTIDAILGLEECSEQRRMSSSPDESSEPSSSPSSSSVLACSGASPVGGTGASSSPRAKRVRTIFSAEQLERLEAEFARQQYMVGPERLVLAASLRLSESQVKVWFQNRRIKWRKQHLEAQQMRLVNWRQHEDQQQQQHQHQPHFLAADEDQESLSD